jgi:hypothetical protein
MSTVTMRVACFPTEDPDRVLSAMINIFPESEVRESEMGFLATTNSLERFKELLRSLRILDTARSVLMRGRSENRTEFSLNKQVAFMGKVSFVDGTVPLGTIDIVLEDDRLEQLIDDIAPTTVDGEIP